MRLQQFQTQWEQGLAKLAAGGGRRPGRGARAGPGQLAHGQDHRRQGGDDAPAWCAGSTRGTDWRKAQGTADALDALNELEKVGREELAADRAALPLYLCDSRMGHLNHGRGCFTAMSILDKIDALERVLEETFRLPGKRPNSRPKTPPAYSPCMSNWMRIGEPMTPTALGLGRLAQGPCITSERITRPSANMIVNCRLRTMKKSSGPSGSITSSLSFSFKSLMTSGRRLIPDPRCQER